MTKPSNTPQDSPAIESSAEMPELRHMLGHHVRRAHLSIWREFNEKVGHGGLRPGQFGMLSSVETNPGISQIEVSRLLDLDKATIVSLTLRLEKEGWITRKQAKEDRRRHELYITPKGRKKVKTLREELEVLETQFSKRFKKSEYNQFIEFLQRIYLPE